MSLRWDSDTPDSQPAPAIWVSDTFSDLHSMKNGLFSYAFNTYILSIVLQTTHKGPMSCMYIYLVKSQAQIESISSDAKTWT